MLMSTGSMYRSSGGGAPPVNPVTFIGSTSAGMSNPGGSPNTVTYANAPIATAASDVICVGVMRESSFGSASISLTVGATTATLWSPGAIVLGNITGGYIEFYYCQPGALATANIVLSANSAAIGAALFVWRLEGVTNTPLDVVSSAQATSTSIALNDIETKVSGAVMALGVCEPVITGYTESWSGSEAVVEDGDFNSPTGNHRVVACHLVPTTTASTTLDLTLTLAASQAHIGGAISFGP